MLVLCVHAVAASAATLRVCASGCDYADLQAAIDAAAPGDTILLRAGETFVGPFLLRLKPASSQWITIRSDAPDSSLPAEGVRLVPSGKTGATTDRSLLPRLMGRGSNYRTTPVIRTEPGAHHYLLKFLEIDGSANEGWETLIAFGDDTTATPAADIVMDRVYAHGHPQKGQKRGVALNSVRTDILNSYISDIAAVGFDSQAIGGYNGAGPYRIINNYLEAAGENIMFGGADPAVSNLVPSNIEIRRNHIYKPPAWEGAILKAPASVGAYDSGTGGSLAAGTHYFKVVALLATGPVVAHSLGSTEAAVTLPGSRTATITWAPVAGAERYRIYRGTWSGGQSVYMETASADTSFAYTGHSEASGSVPTSATVWVVKNLIELKNAEQVVIDGNVIENVWPAAQNGYAIVITPVNQSGTAPWVRVRDVTFSNNIIRNAAGVLTLTGYDDYYPSQQTQRIAFRNNLIYDIDPRGGWNKTFVMGNGPAEIVIDRNTIIHKDTSVVFASGPQIHGFTFTNNITPHNEYGIMGDNGRTGTYSIDMYFPGGVLTNNVFGGGPASLYPMPNAFPTEAEFYASFVDPANHDYRLRSSSTFYTAGAGGSVPGADFSRLSAALSGGTQPPPSGGGGGGTSPPSSDNTAPVPNHGGPYSVTAGMSFSADGSRSTDAENNISSYAWHWGDDILIRASQVPASSVVGSAWTRVQASGAADGIALHNPDQGAPKATAALATPASYVDVRFNAASGVPYRIWFRMRAQADHYSNDSMFVQFSGRVDGQGRAIHRIGTTEAVNVSLETGIGAGVAGWGWNDENYGTIGDPVYFATAGMQTLRIQQREDGIMWDQIVISAGAHSATAPGSAKNDGTILPLTFGTSASAVSTHSYASPGQYPLTLTVTDSGALSAYATTSVTVLSQGSSGGILARAGGPYAGVTGQMVTFDGSGSTAPASAQYSWSFGDDIAIRASELRITGTRWRTIADPSAAGGVALENPDAGEPKLTSAIASPSSYVEATFRAAAGVPYRVWIRMRAANDAWTNDSIFVQFSGSVTSTDTPVHRIGSNDGMRVFLEDGTATGLAAWGWGDNVYGGVGTPVYFNTDGEQRIRVQQREDGVRIDQIVISAGSYATTAPGSVKNDTTIVPLFPSAAQGAVVNHVYRYPGLFPVTLVIEDGGGSGRAGTTASIK